MDEEEILQVWHVFLHLSFEFLTPAGPSIGVDSHASVEHPPLQRHDGSEPRGGPGVGGGRREEAPVLVLNEDITALERCEIPRIRNIMHGFTRSESGIKWDD